MASHSTVQQIKVKTNIDKIIVISICQKHQIAFQVWNFVHKLRFADNNIISPTTGSKLRIKNDYNLLLILRGIDEWKCSKQKQIVCRWSVFQSDIIWWMFLHNYIERNKDVFFQNTMNFESNFNNKNFRNIFSWQPVKHLQEKTLRITGYRLLTRTLTNEFTDVSYLSNIIFHIMNFPWSRGFFEPCVAQCSSMGFIVMSGTSRRFEVFPVCYIIWISKYRGQYIINSSLKYGRDEE